MSDDVANFSDETLELIHLKVTAKHQKPTHICLLYRPPASSISCTITRLRDCLLKLDLNCHTNEFVLMGDLNIDFLKKPSAGYKKLIDLSRQFNIHQQITEPTRITNVSCILIDLCFTNIRHVSDSGTIM